jgi:hypothetical protein
MMDYLRQLRLLDPSSIGNKSVTIIGAGATGSFVALALAQLGWGDSKRGQGKMIVFDGDVVERHNLANQAYELSHIGKPKVEALAEMIKRKCGAEIEIHNCMVDDKTDSGLIQSNYVFLLTDTMSSRKSIFEKHLKFPFKTDLLIETRMGLRDGRVYAFNPNSVDETKCWTDTLYSDADAEVSACGASESIITTVMFIASLATQRLVHHFNTRYGSDSLSVNGSGNKAWNEVHFSLYPETFYLRVFGEEPVLAFKP